MQRWNESISHNAAKGSVDLVGNPEDRFSHNEAHLKQTVEEEGNFVSLMSNEMRF